MHPHQIPDKPVGRDLFAIDILRCPNLTALIIPQDTSLGFIEEEEEEKEEKEKEEKEEKEEEEKEEKEKEEKEEKENNNNN
uniref:Uncharacterized protein n=1 Tax=Sphaerodactylus townsendi TaxID=933632 RepID=A0ACB8ENM5_9SAUR